MLDSGSPNAAHARRGASATMSAPTQQPPLRLIPSRILMLSSSIPTYRQQVDRAIIRRMVHEKQLSYSRDSGAGSPQSLTGGLARYWPCKASIQPGYSAGSWLTSSSVLRSESV